MQEDFKRFERRQPAALEGNPKLEFVKNPLYDTETITSLTTQVTFFATPLSAGKNRRQTNLIMSSALGYPRVYYLYGVLLQTQYGMPYADVVLFYNSTWAEIKIGSKDYLVVPITLIPSGLNLYGFAVADASAAAVLQQSWGNGVPALDNMFNVSIQGTPIYIPSLQTFNATLNISPNMAALTADFEARMVFWGVEGREVQ